MEWYQYFWPVNIIAQVVVVFLFTIFIGWCGIVGFLWWKFKKWQKQLNDCQEVSTLIITKPNLVNTQKKIKGKDLVVYSEPENGPKVDSKQMFVDFCTAKHLKPGNPIARHLQIIFEAGLVEGRLEIGELLKHTANVIFKENSILKGVLSSYIIIGLLGTLIGLANSLGNFQPKNFDIKDSSSIVPGIFDMLDCLKGAFAPSICGILFTLLGIFFLMIYLHFCCSPLKSTLDYLTLNIWVPKLYQTTTQKLLETSEEQVRKSINAAEKVATFAENIETKTSDLKSNLETTNTTLVSMTNSAVQVDQIVKEFSSSVNSLTSFQQEIRKLYEQLLNESSSFRQSIAATIDESSEFQKGTVKIYDRYDGQIQEHLKALHTYEESYIAARQQIEKKIEEVLDVARTAFDATSEKDRASLENIGKTLIENLDHNLGEIVVTLTNGLTDLHLQFNRFENPMNKAAEKISGSLETVENRTTTLVNELKKAFIDTIEKIDKKISEQPEKITGSLEAIETRTTFLVNELKKAFTDITEKIDKKLSEPANLVLENKPLPGPEIEVLNNNLSNLANAITELNRNTDKFSAGKGNSKFWLVTSVVSVVLLIATSFALGYQMNLSKNLSRATNVYPYRQNNLFNMYPPQFGD
jgi:hypothetical protein